MKIWNLFRRRPRYRFDRTDRPVSGPYCCLTCRKEVSEMSELGFMFLHFCGAPVKPQRITLRDLERWANEAEQREDRRCNHLSMDKPL